MKSARIENRQRTRQKRKKQIPRVAELKLQKLTRKKRELLKRLFLEAKWFYNWLIADLDSRLPSSETDKATEVEIKVKEHMEHRELKILSSQMKQEIRQMILNSLKALSRAKAQGRKVGRLNFKTSFRSIPLKQPGVTFKFLNPQKTKVRIQRLGCFRALGGRAIPEEAEIAKAYLVRRATGYFLIVTYYVAPEKELEIRKHGERFERDLGIDFGIRSQLTLSNGIKISWQIEESKRLKKIQRLMAKLSDNRKKRILQRRLAAEYQRLRNIRKDIQNKIISLLKRYRRICFQDDSIKSWHEGWFGAQVQHSAPGGITARLKGFKKLPESPATPGVELVPRYETTTQECSRCGHHTAVGLNDRIFHCPACGLILDRDVNAACVMIRKVGLDRPEGPVPMPEEVAVVKRLFGPLRRWLRVSFPPPLQESHSF